MFKIYIKISFEIDASNVICLSINTMAYSVALFSPCAYIILTLDRRV